MVAGYKNSRFGFASILGEALPAFSLNLCGLVAIRLWIQCNIYDRYTSTDSGIITIVTNLVRVAVIFVLLAIALRRGYVGRTWHAAQAMFSSRALSALSYASVFLMTLSSALFFINEGQPNMAVLITACVCAGAGIVWGGGMWICHYVRMQTNEALFYAFVSLGVSSALGFFVGLMDPGISYLISMLMPPLSVVMYQKARIELDARHQASRLDSGTSSQTGWLVLDESRDSVYDKEPKSTFIRLIGGIVCFNLVLGIARGFPDGTSIALPVPFQVLHQSMVVLLSLGLIWWALGAKKKVRFSTLWNISVTLIVLGVLLLAFLDNRLDPLGGTLISISNTFAVGLLWYCCYDVARHSSVAAYVVLGIAWAAHILPREIGRAGIWLLEPQSTAVTLLIAFMVLALAVTMVLLLNDSIPNTRRIFAELGEGGALILACEGSAGRKTRSQADSSVEDAHENTTACADARWQMLSKRYFLTEREIEVVRLLTQGRSRADIGKKLYITENTVRTHLKSVYGKLGIHSKQGLIDLLENQK